MRCQNLIECSLSGQLHLRSCRRESAGRSMFCGRCEAAIDSILEQNSPDPPQTPAVPRKPPQRFQDKRRKAFRQPSASR